MPTLEQLINRREKEAAQASTYLNSVVRAMQATAYGLLLEWLTDKINTDDQGRIKYSASNLGRVAGIFVLFNKFQRLFQKTALGAILDRAERFFELNGDYFNIFSNPPESVADAARRLTLQRWGFNTVTKELIPGGYMESLFNNQNTARRVSALVNRAIASKMSLSEFQKQFRKVFVGNPGQGMLEKHWRVNSFDLFQKIDRSANLVYADRLGLNYAVYSGTVMDTTRPFCEARVHKVFSRQEIEAWANLEWAGKIEVGYDPYLDCGGYNCRHHLSFISNEIAAHLRPELKN